MDNSNKNKADNAQGENMQQQWRQQSSNLKAAEERPYRRRIKPPPAKVRVHAARFRRFVQRRTCCLKLPQPNAPPSASNDSGDTTPSDSASPMTTNLLQPPAAAAMGNITRKSMQEAYMSWCSCNDIPLSPGTMAELAFTEHPLQ